MLSIIIHCPIKLTDSRWHSACASIGSGALSPWRNKSPQADGCAIDHMSASMGKQCSGSALTNGEN